MNKSYNGIRINKIAPPVRLSQVKKRELDPINTSVVLKDNTGSGPTSKE